MPCPMPFLYTISTVRICHSPKKVPSKFQTNFTAFITWKHEKSALTRHQCLEIKQTFITACFVATEFPTSNSFSNNLVWLVLTLGHSSWICIEYSACDMKRMELFLSGDHCSRTLTKSFMNNCSAPLLFRRLVECTLLNCRRKEGNIKYSWTVLSPLWQEVVWFQVAQLWSSYMYYLATCIT